MNADAAQMNVSLMREAFVPALDEAASIPHMMYVHLRYICVHLRSSFGWSGA
jgi:hypothetical protein